LPADCSPCSTTVDAVIPQALAEAPKLRSANSTDRKFCPSASFEDSFPEGSGFFKRIKESLPYVFVGNDEIELDGRRLWTGMTV